MGKVTKPRKRWMASVLKASNEATVILPFKRGQRGGAAARLPRATPRLLRSA